MLVSHGPWWWIRVLPPGAVVTVDEYSIVEPAVAAEMAIDRSMSVFCPVPTTQSSGPIRVAIRPMIAAADRAAARATAGRRDGYDRRVTDPSAPGRSNLPRVAILDGPTPLQPMPRLTEALGGRAELWIKREDLGPITFSGNKLRNLEFLLGAALDEGADTIVTSGRRWSNHCRLAAAAGRRLGLDVHLVISGPRVEASQNLGLIELFGGTVHQAETDGRLEREGMVDAVATDLRARGRKVTVVPVGGSGATGAWGQVLAALEVADQGAARGFAPDAIVLPSASGGTQAGLVVGTAMWPRPARVIGVLAARPEAELRPVIERLVLELAALAEIDAPEAIELDGSQLGAGYGRLTAASDEATVLLTNTEGILVDPVYTAKGLAGLIALVRAGALDGKRVVFWHGGGLPAIFEDLGSAV